MKLKYAILLICSSVIVALDQYSKFLVVQRFRLLESHSIIDGLFNLTYIRNTGAAFGIFAETEAAFRVPFFLVVPLVALAFLAWIFKRIADRDYKLALALALVVGGAIGNLIDRVSLGYVVDFLDFHWRGDYHFPAFNIADSAICVGVGFLMLDLLKDEKPNEKPDGKNDRAPTPA